MSFLICEVNAVLACDVLGINKLTFARCSNAETDYHEESKNYSVVLSKSLHVKHVLFPKMLLLAASRGVQA